MNATAAEQLVDEVVAPGPRRLQFEFHGQGGEYFRIWIVNILLTLVTLGLYSPWAKVRSNRYLYGSTLLDGHSFEYLADPLRILKGRLVAVAVMIVAIVSIELLPALLLFWVAALVIVLPWVICKALSFRNFNSSYRNVRFGFDGRYGQALLCFVLLPVLVVLTLGLLLPYALMRQSRFIAGGSRYGTCHFQPGFTGGDFYAIYLVGLFGAIFFLVVMFALSFLAALMELPALVAVLGTGAGLVFYLLIGAYLAAETTNAVYGKTRLGEHKLISRMTTTGLAKVWIGNAVILVFTLGLGYPLTRIRLARYRASCLALVAAGPLDDFVSAEEREVSALGEELGEALDLDIGV